MRTLVLRKDNTIYERDWIYDEEKENGEYVETPVNESYILTYLSDTIKLEEGFTLRDYFKLITKYSGLWLLDGYFDSFIREYVNCPDSGCISEDLKNITLAKTVTISNYEDVTDICDMIDVYAESDNLEEKYSLSFVKLNELLDLPIKLAPAQCIHEYSQDKFISRNSDIYEGKYYYTLFEFIQSIVYELSFYGTPEERDAEDERLQEIVTNIRDGKEKLIPMEEVMKEFEK